MPQFTVTQNISDRTDPVAPGEDEEAEDEDEDEEEDEDEGGAALPPAEARQLFGRAIMAMGLHVLLGSRLWAMYRAYKRRRWRAASKRASGSDDARKAAAGAQDIESTAAAIPPPLAHRRHHARSDEAALLDAAGDRGCGDRDAGADAGLYARRRGLRRRKLSDTRGGSERLQVRRGRDRRPSRRASARARRRGEAGAPHHHPHGQRPGDGHIGGDPPLPLPGAERLPRVAADAPGAAEARQVQGGC